VFEALTRLKELDDSYDPTYGTDVMVGVEDSATADEKSSSNLAIRNRIGALLSDQD
jgi:hypothetical protein